MTFKPGDRVRCVDAKGPFGWLQQGREYVISQIESGIDDDDDRKYIFLDGNRVIGYRPDRFELVPNVIDAICRGEVPAWTRVRCVDDDHYAGVLKRGCDYLVDFIDDGFVRLQGQLQHYNLHPARFKPVVRVRTNSCWLSANTHTIG